MSKTTLLVLALLVSPVAAKAQAVDDCPTCSLGIYDEIQMLHNFGDIVPFVLEDLFMGVRLGAGYSTVTSIEFSITGMRAGEDGILLFSLETTTTPPAAVILGTVQAPADTSATSPGVGGMNIAWPDCVPVSQALVKMQILAVQPLSNHVIRVTHRFPPTDARLGTHPAFSACDPPLFTAVRVTGLDYVLGGVVGVEDETWSAVKGMYRR